MTVYALCLSSTPRRVLRGVGKRGGAEAGEPSGSFRALYQ